MTGAVLVRSPAEHVVSYSSAGSANGIHGPFDWIGGSLEVSVGKWVRIIRAEVLGEEELVSVVVPGRTGEIILRGIPEEANGLEFVAKLGLGLPGQVFQPSDYSSEGVVFRGLPAGKYMVGPRSWVVGSEMQGLISRGIGEMERTGPVVLLKSGGIARVDWQESWGNARDLHGSVRILGPRELTPYLFPIYGLGELEGREAGQAPRVVLGRARGRMGTAQNGEYSIPAWTPVPDLILVCLGDAEGWNGVQGMHILETIEPGESLALETGAIELHWIGNAPTLGAVVSYKIPGMSLRHPVHSFLDESKRHWYPGEPLLLEGVPISVRKFALGDRWLEVAPKARAIQRLDVDFDALPKIIFGGREASED